MTFDNQDRTLDFDAAEIEVLRRLHRSGENEYFLNRQSAKLKEIGALFRDTGVGIIAYSILHQGKIDQVLSHNPARRREFFEEAASISKTKLEMRQAEQNLKKTSENIVQARQIFAEVAQSDRHLAEQAKKAEQYRVLRKELAQLEIDAKLLQLAKLAQDLSSRRQKFDELSTIRDTQNRDMATLNRQQETIQKTTRKQNHEHVTRQQELTAIEIELERLNSTKRSNTAQIAEIDGQIARETMLMNGYKERTTVLIEEIAERKETIAQTNQRISDLHREQASYRKTIEARRLKLQENKAAITSLQKQIRADEHKQRKQRATLITLTDNIGTLVDQRLRESEYSAAKHRGIESKIGAAIDILDKTIRAKRQITIDATAINDLNSALQTCQTLRDEFDEDIEKVKRLKLLFEEYKKLLPLFLNEFISPDGSITRKRTIEHNIAERDLAITRTIEDVARITKDNESIVQEIDNQRALIATLEIDQSRMAIQLKHLRQTDARTEQEIARYKNQSAEVERHIDHSKQRAIALRVSNETIDKQTRDLLTTKRQKKNDIENYRDSLKKQHSDLSLLEDTIASLRGEMNRLQPTFETARREIDRLESRLEMHRNDFEARFSRAPDCSEENITRIRKKSSNIHQAIAKYNKNLEELGQINLMATQDYKNIHKRYLFLKEQISDLEHARQNLHKMSKDIITLSSEKFKKTFDQINKHYNIIFRRLFGGGHAELRLTDSDEVLSSGIEIFIRPPGKKNRTIELLSGGERTLAAVALLFAAYRVHPSPFCILDEVDAALDDSNIEKFTNLLQEFTKKSQFILITHNKNTIATANRLFGITMEEPGISKAVGVRITQDVLEHSSYDDE